MCGKNFNYFKNADSRKKTNLILSMVYGFVWSIGKILFGAFTGAYFFCVSGASSLLFAFVKKIYLKNFESEQESEKRSQSMAISVLIVVSGLLFTFYMARLFFIDEAQQYGLIWSIAIATASFVELGMSIYNLKKANKTNDVLLQSFRGCNLSASCYAIVLTQVALLSATETSANLYNAITGVAFGCIAVIIGVICIVRASKTKKYNELESKTNNFE